MLDTFAASSRDEERQQALIRLMIVGLILFSLLAVSFNNPSVRPIVVIAFGYWVFSFIWFGLVRWLPNRLLGRRYIPIISDLVMTTIAMHSMNNHGVILYPFMLWLIVSNGFHFGQRQLLVALLIGVAGFAFVINNTSYWQSNILVGFSLLVGMVMLSIFFFKLINRFKQEIKHAEFSATHDPITGLLNHAYFMNRLEYEVNRAERYGNQFCLFYVDIDDFKQLNDRYGHQQGDKILEISAARLLATVRNTDIVARLGNNKFAILALSLSDQIAIEQLSARLIETINTPLNIRDKSCAISAKVSISTFPFHGTSVSALLHAVDHAMNRSKHLAHPPTPLPLTKSAA